MKMMMPRKTKPSAEKTVREIRRATRKHYSSEEKIRIVLEGLRGKDRISELCRREGINATVYYRWSKEILVAGTKRLAGDTVREATTEEVWRFVSYYNHERYHECLHNLTPADVFYGRGERILEQRGLIKQNTLATRKQTQYANQNKPLT
jgi:transposase-like protein